MRCGWCEDIVFALYVIILLALGTPSFLIMGDAIVEIFS